MRTISVSLLIAAVAGSACISDLSAQPGTAAPQGASTGGAKGSGSQGTYVSGGGSGSIVQLAGFPEVQEDIAMTDKQKAAIRAITQRLQAFDQKMLEGLKNPPATNRAQWHIARQEAGQREVDRAGQAIARELTPVQMQRLGQISLQVLGAQALFDPGVIKALGLSQVQQQSLARIRAEMNEQVMASVRGRPAGLTRSVTAQSAQSGGKAMAGAGGGASTGAGFSTNKAGGDIIREGDRKMLQEVLTPQQQVKLKELQGKPCPLKPRYMMRSGGGGGGYQFSGQGGGPQR